MVAAAGNFGVAINLAGADLQTGLNNLILQVINNMTLQLEFELSQTNVDPATIVATVDGVEVVATYNEATNTVQLSSAGTTGSTIVIEYCLKSHDGGDDGGDDCDKRKGELICHIPAGDLRKARTLRVGAPAVRAHLGHGDRLGACETHPDILEVMRKKNKAYLSGNDQCERNDSGKPEKALLCHIPAGDLGKALTIKVGAPAVDAHLGHGDRSGKCESHSDILEVMKEVHINRWLNQ